MHKCPLWPYFSVKNPEYIYSKDGDSAQLPYLTISLCCWYWVHHIPHWGGFTCPPLPFSLSPPPAVETASLATRASGPLSLTMTSILGHSFILSSIYSLHLPAGGLWGTFVIGDIHSGTRAAYYTFFIGSQCMLIIFFVRGESILLASSISSTIILLKFCPVLSPCLYIVHKTSEEGITFDQWTKCSSQTCPLFRGSTVEWDV